MLKGGTKSPLEAGRWKRSGMDVRPLGGRNGAELSTARSHVRPVRLFRASRQPDAAASKVRNAARAWVTAS